MRSLPATDPVPPAAPGGSEDVVLSRSHVLGSLALWLADFIGLVIFSGLINGVPILLRDAGLSPQRATLV